ncbi:Zn-dependent alcohol dehydrogenase [Actinocrinis puniceicyclus]|uniref:Zn-dependent alcohol dehydrogenase n=1 Tax=Actinocrinis puniceicyclus TaxID=977794 RepID=A0A8J7WMW7_9ACTN|nr:Zn-dependent alcohol dehydrogenase [Actinocrinis puniceicyclus]MBS2965296.1 Zn-dependent alcohol dehydrogenase [Actinocrinis puniceicyclus]
MRAMLVRRSGQDPELRADVRTRAVGPGDVRVRIRASGVCHSDLSAIDGVLPNKRPFVPGHEGAGEVVEVGAQASGLAVGDHVVVCWVPPCGHCANCLRGEANLCSELFAASALTANFTVDGAPLYGVFGTGTWAEEVVLPWQSAVPVDKDVPFDVAALIGCAVTTGVGAVLNTARVEPGSSVAVIGCGGVGIAAVQGARLAGAADIVAIDPSAAKRELVARFGATRAVAPEDALAARDELTGRRGFDYVFECVGRGELVRQAYDMARRGGAVVVIGAGGRADMVSLSMAELFYDGKRILSSWYGGADARVEYGRLVRLWRAGRLDLESMITARLPLESVGDALDLMRSGEGIRSVIEF